MENQAPPDFTVDMSDAESFLGEEYYLWPAFETQTDLQIAECYWEFRLKRACVKAVAKARKEWKNGTD